MSGRGDLEEPLNNILSPLRVLQQAEEPSQVCYAIIKEIQSFDKKRLLGRCVNSIAAQFDIPSADIWRCFNSLIQLRNYVHSNKFTKSSLWDILSRNSFSDDFIKVITSFMNSEQFCEPAILNAVSKYPPFRSVRCRFQITIGRMVLLHAPDVMLQFWLRVGNGYDGCNWRTGTAVGKSASAEEEKIFLMDFKMLNRFIEEIEKIMSVACKLERLHLK